MSDNRTVKYAHYTKHKTYINLPLICMTQFLYGTEFSAIEACFGSISCMKHIIPTDLALFLLTLYPYPLCGYTPIFLIVIG